MAGVCTERRGRVEVVVVDRPGDEIPCNRKWRERIGEFADTVEGFRGYGENVVSRASPSNIMSAVVSDTRFDIRNVDVAFIHCNPVHNSVRAGRCWNIC